MTIDSQFVESQAVFLGQSVPGATATAIYTLPANLKVILKTCLVCNTGTTTVMYRIFHDEAGSTYNNTTALIFDAPLFPNETKLIEMMGVMEQAGGTVGVYGSTSDVTFTLYGAEFTT